MHVALDATPLILSSGGLARYVTELSLALAREFPQDSYTLLSDQSFSLPAGAPMNLSAASPAEGQRPKRWWLLGLRKALRQNGAQVFHGTNFEVPSLGRTPAVLTIHDLSPWRNRAWQPASSRARTRTPLLLWLHRARIIVTVSEAVRREVIDFFSVPAEMVRSVPLAAAPSFAPIAKAAIPWRRPFFLFVGTLEPRKNLASLIQAWSASRSQTGAELLIVGRQRSDFAALAPCEGLSVLGEVADSKLPELYSQAMAFVYPSHYEGFGLPVLEAMQCGCPVITSKDPAITEVASGAAIHTANIREMAEAMVNIARNTTLRKDLCSAGLTRARCFSWQRTARETRAIYAEALS